MCLGSWGIQFYRMIRPIRPGSFPAARAAVGLDGLPADQRAAGIGAWTRDRTDAVDHQRGHLLGRVAAGGAELQVGISNFSFAPPRWVKRRANHWPRPSAGRAAHPRFFIYR